MDEKRTIGAGIGFGLAGGALVGMLADNFSLWIAVGICLGVGVGKALSTRRADGAKGPRTPA